MKAKISKDGQLIVIGESDLESYALKQWAQTNHLTPNLIVLKEEGAFPLFNKGRDNLIIPDGPKGTIEELAEKIVEYKYQLEQTNKSKGELSNLYEVLREEHRELKKKYAKLLKSFVDKNVN